MSGAGTWLLVVLVVLGILTILAAPLVAVGAITFLRLMRKEGKK